MTGNKLQKLNNRQKTMANIALRLVIIAALVFFAIMPAAANIKTIRNNIIAKKIELDKSNTQSQTYSKLAQTLEEISPKLELLDNVFINRNRELEFITTLEGIAQENHVTQTIKLGDPVKDGANTYTKVPLSLTLSGSDTDTFNYVVGLENLVYYININSINIQAKSINPRTPAAPNQSTLNPGGTSASAAVDMYISADTFWQN